MPGRFNIATGSVGWAILIVSGRTTTLNPARIEVSGASAGEYGVTAPDGREVGKVSPCSARGHHHRQREGQAMKVDLADAQDAYVVEALSPRTELN